MLPATRLFLAILVATVSYAEITYRKPPRAILDVLDAPEPPRISISPARTHAILLERLRYPPIAELAQPMSRLAGVRINPKTNGPRRTWHYFALTLVDLNDGGRTPVQLPRGARVSELWWSPDGARFAFLNTNDNGIAVWVGETASATVRPIENIAVNAVLGHAVKWMPDSHTLLVSTVPADRGDPPTAPQAPRGPLIQEVKGEAGPVRTYQDLLKNEHDAALFDYYATGQLVLVDLSGGGVTAFGKPDAFRGISVAPDGKHVMVSRLLKPYSYLFPYYRFPYSVEVWNDSGEMVRELARMPVADNVPIGGVPTGPRIHYWKPTEPATIIFVEALDDGDPKKKVPHRDRLLLTKAPFDSEPQELMKVEQRFTGLSWFETGGKGLVSDYDRDRRWMRTFIIGGDEPKLLWDRSIQDRYADPGQPHKRALPSGHYVVTLHDGQILLTGAGASPKGDRPFLDRLSLTTGETERLFHCNEERFEYVVEPLNDSGTRFLTRRESETEPPNYFLHDTRAGAVTAITNFKNPAPQLQAITKRRVTYKRDDGVDLSFTLYLPPGYKEGSEPLPTIFWAYPREYNTARTAGQIRGSTKKFTILTGYSHLFFLLEGYAILDGATLPVIGDPETANNTYIEQIVAGAKAAIGKAVELGVTDPLRVGVGGHSYGAFMTANLMAHSDLFRAGIARSGAYNRSLTPFGFQNERRTFWEAPEIYFKMSPFMSAHKINEPLLLIHGAADNNSGTFPVQSERMYHAVGGNGGTVRLVMLPHESHGYAARESIEHTLAEMVEWFDEYVKGARP